jgi:hypothetical protein
VNPKTKVREMEPTGYWFANFIHANPEP